MQQGLSRQLPSVLVPFLLKINIIYCVGSVSQSNNNKLREFLTCRNYVDITPLEAIPFVLNLLKAPRQTFSVKSRCVCILLNLLNNK